MERFTLKSALGYLHKRGTFNSWEPEISPVALVTFTTLDAALALRDSFKSNSDIRVECTHGIHFFLTREEAEKW